MGDNMNVQRSSVRKSVKSRCLSPLVRRQREPAATVFDDMAVVHGPSLLRWALTKVSQASDARDLVQDTFERALRRRPPVSDQRELRRWLFTVMRNRHLDYRRARAVRIPSGVDVDTLPGAAAEPIEMWKRIDIDAVHALVPALSPPLRDAFTLYMAGYSGIAIAQQLLISPNTVTTRVFRARQRLRQMAEAAFAQIDQDAAAAS
jgi:RNA polymerase sigma-70 factor (ECF subfamily)